MRYAFAFVALAAVVAADSSASYVSALLILLSLVVASTLSGCLCLLFLMTRGTRLRPFDVFSHHSSYTNDEADHFSLDQPLHIFPH